MSFIPTRYPYTYAADYIRGLFDTSGISRAEAAHLISSIAQILERDREAIAKIFADAYLEKWDIKKVDVNHSREVVLSLRVAGNLFN